MWLNVPDHDGMFNFPDKHIHNQFNIIMTSQSEIYNRSLSMVEYTRTLFQEYKNITLISSTPSNFTPTDLPTQMIADCRHIAAIIAAATENQSITLIMFNKWLIWPHVFAAGKLPWSVKDYLQGKAAGSSPEKLRKDFPPEASFQRHVTIEDPMILIDSVGTILLWYLPNIISQAALVGI